MNDALLKDLEADGFGHWLAGFIDGEGCFIIREARHRSKQQPLNCAFALCLRHDDRAILEEACRRTNLGRLMAIQKRRDGRPQVRWVIDKKADTLALVALLERFPLRAKKARDFVVWKEAVSAWQEVRNGRPKGGSAPADWTVIRRLKAELSAQRAYHPTQIQ